VQIASPVGWTSRVAASGEARLVHELFHAAARPHAGGLVVAVSAPLADDERRPGAQSRLERSYRSARPTPENAVFFESFYGQSAACNPLGIDRALAASDPAVRRYWSVVDGSVAIPEGGIRLIEGSREWWRVRASARALVVNDWLRKRYRRRPHQRVLQTWHGTMLKRLALDRGLGLRTRIAVLRERDRWDVLLAQNPYSARIFRSAYAMKGPIWEEGYPRNDVLHDPARAAHVRDVVGIPAGARVVLYAPTWRDDRTEMVDFVDLAAFARELGPDHVLLVRGHSRTLRHGQDLFGAGLIDVTSYPDMADLLDVADLLVTDYSSVMFDFAATARPIVFFTPDLAHYSADLRGFYFDLLAEAPGPVVSTREELRDAVLASADGQPEFAERAAAWRERFTPRDDGTAGARVVARMRAEGWFAP
jgi:CDP-glycerol glycerophosphotransferase (TagB/SpsB family)